MRSDRLPAIMRGLADSNPKLKAMSLDKVKQNLALMMILLQLQQPT